MGKHIPPGTNVVKVFFPAKQESEKEVVKQRPAAPRPAEARHATGQLIALPYYAFVDQVDFEKRLRRLEQVEAWMVAVAVETMEVEDAYEILGVCIEAEYMTLYSEDFQAYALFVIRMANEGMRADAKLLHADKLTNNLTRPLEARCSEALKYILNTFNLIKDMWSVQRIPAVECPTVVYTLSSVPALLLKWKKQDFATTVCITIGDDPDGGVTINDERTLDPGDNCITYYYDEYPNLFDCEHTAIFHLYHIGMNGAQEGMRSPATRCTVECPEEYRDIVEDIEYEKKVAKLRARQAELRAKLARAKAELKRERGAADDGRASHKRPRNYKDWADTPPWRQSSEWKALRRPWIGSSWKSWSWSRW